MALCNASCAVDVPQFTGAGCKITTRKGGISHIGFIKCDYQFVDVTDAAEWATAVAADDVHIVSEGVGSKPETSKVTQKLSSCRPATMVGETHTLPFRTYAVDDTLYTDFDVHNDVRNNIEAYRMFWIGCDGLFYLNPAYATASAGFDVSVNKWDYVVNEDSNEPVMYDIELAFDHIGIVAGLDLTGVQAVLN
jgi:hypothetical protein